MHKSVIEFLNEQKIIYYKQYGFKGLSTVHAISNLTDNIESALNNKHGTIIRTVITCKKIPCYMRDSACSWCIVGNVKIF